MKIVPGEIYIIGERDHITGENSSYYKIGIVRKNEDQRTSEKRLEEHQTGNPRPLYTHSVYACEMAERIETLMHGMQARLRLGDREWFQLDDQQLAETVKLIEQFVNQAAELAPIFAESERLKKESASAEVLPANESLIELHRSLLVAELRSKRFTALEKEIRQLTRAALDRGENLGGTARISSTSIRDVFDKTAFQEAHPAIYEEFLKVSVTESRKWALTRPRSDEALIGSFEQNYGLDVSAISEAIALVANGTQSASSLNQQVLICREHISQAKWDTDVYLAKLKVAVGTNAGIDGLCKWGSIQRTSRTFQEAAFKEAHPELYASFSITKTTGGATLLNPGVNPAQSDASDESDSDSE